MERNEYPGINPHLNSRLQGENGGWEAFHASYIDKLVDELDRSVPANYYAISEKSLQITMLDPATQTPIGRSRTTRPDALVLRQDQPASGFAVHPIGTPTLTIPVTEGFDDEEYLMGLVVYRFETGELPGISVTRIELLSPANKPGGSHYAQYLRNRRETLQSGLRLVELDFLHETRPVIARIPSYPDGAPDAYPYSIIVSDPRPTLDEGKTDVYGFSPDQPIPVIDVPLDGQDTVRVDFGRVYNKMFERRAFALMTDYQHEPQRFDTYSERDQVYIRSRMAEIRAASGDT
jgi:hypothetical protein